MKKTCFLLLIPVSLALAKPIVLDNSSATCVSVGQTAVQAPETSEGAFTIQPRPLGETELYWDDGVRTSAFYQGSYSPYATTFTAPADCRLMTYRFYWYGGHNVDINCFLYADDGTGYTPTGETRFTVTGNTGTTSDNWCDVDVSGTEIILTGGKVFHPAWGYPMGVYGLRLDTYKGSGTCWYTENGVWSQDTTYTHMMRVVINDDVYAPYIQNLDPADGETDVPGDTNIVFDVIDDDAGVNGDSIYIEVEGVDVTADCDITDNGDGTFSVSYDPPSDFIAGQVVDIYGYAEDLLGNSDEGSWSFTIQDDWSVVNTTWGQIKNLN